MLLLSIATFTPTAPATSTCAPSRSRLRPAALTNNVIGRFDNLSRVADRSEQSRVEIVSGGSVDFQGGSLTLAS
ncbi:hypothetical protein KZ847_25780, partial [Pseudomonas aeruginosa]